MKQGPPSESSHTSRLTVSDVLSRLQVSWGNVFPISRLNPTHSDSVGRNAARAGMGIRLQNAGTLENLHGLDLTGFKRREPVRAKTDLLDALLSVMIV